jgi:hypothetical protein
LPYLPLNHNNYIIDLKYAFMNRTNSIFFSLFLFWGLYACFGLINSHSTSTIQNAYAENTFYIKSQLNGYVLGTDSSTGYIGASVIVEPQSESPSANQLWTITDDGHIKNQASGNVLDIANSNSLPGASVVVYSQNEPPTANQHWTVTSDGYIKSQLNGYVLDVSHSSTFPGASVVVYPQNEPPSANQHWELVPAP